MKKIAPIAAIALFAIATTSCKKNYTCECVSTSNGTQIGTTSFDIKDKKSNAETECNKGDSEVTAGGVTAKTDCEIK